MGYIAAVLHKKGEDASEHMLTMLQNTNKIKGTYNIASPHNNEHHNCTPRFTAHTTSTLLATKTTDPEKYPPDPLTQSTGATAFEGLLYHHTEPDSLTAANILEEDPEKGVKKLIKNQPGAFIIASIQDKQIICGRDPVGTVPLYYGENKTIAVVASTKKMIWSQNLTPIPLKPGYIIKITPQKTITQKICEIKQQKPNNDSIKQTLETIDRILQDAATQLTKKTPKGTVSFSGGIDSTLVAHYLDQAGATLDLICVGVNEQKEYAEAESAASALGIDLEIHRFTLEDIEEVLDEVIQSVEDYNPMKIGVAIPLYLATKTAVENGNRNIFSGNGADELFGGYRKYQREYMEQGESVRDTMFNDLVNSWSNNFDRDHKICNDQGAQLHLLFTHLRLIQYGLTVPTHYKLSKNPENTRKIILRKLAKQQGIPEKISYRPKKAAQYSTGVNKTLKKIAKKHKMKLNQYLEKRFRELRTNN